MRRRRSGVRGGVVAVVLAILVGCSPTPADVSSDPIDAVAEEMARILRRERADSVSEIWLSEDYGSVTFVKDGEWHDWSVYPGSSRYFRKTEQLPSRSTGISVDQAVAMAKQLRPTCSGDDYRVKLSVVSSAATLVELTCDPEKGPAVTQLNSEDVRVLKGGWTKENLEILWREVRSVAGGTEVKSLDLRGDAVSVSLLDEGTDCAVEWVRYLTEQRYRIARSWCSGGESYEDPISLDRFTAARVATAVESASRSFGVTDTSEVSVSLHNKSKYYGTEFPRNHYVLITGNSNSATIDANDW